jgi:hypothetical protein
VLVTRPNAADYRSYVRDLSERGGVRVDQLSSDTLRELETAGIHRTDLRRIAGEDGVIRGSEFDQVFALLDGRGTDRAGRSSDIQRADRVYRSLRSEVERASARDPALAPPRDPAISGTGLRAEMGRIDRRGSGGRPAITYAANDLPDLRHDRAAPERPCWFVRMLEFLFQWLPGVNTHEQRLQQYGRDLADRHGSDIQAYREAYRRRAEAGPRDIMGRVDTDPTEAMTEHLADRFQDEARARGRPISRDEALSSARTVVTAMNARLEENRTRNAGRVGDLPGGLTDTAGPEAARLADAYFPAWATANDLGGRWGARLDAAMLAPPADHPVITSNPDRRDRAANATRLENVRSVSYLMAMERSGQLEHVPPDAIDGLLAAQRAGLIDGESVAEAANALEHMPATERDRTLAAIRAVPEDRRFAAWATLGREHLALRASSETVRAGGIARVNLAAEQLGRMTPAQARDGLDQGTLGLVADRARVTHRVGGRNVTTDVPVYFHPSIPEARREGYRAMVAEAYGRIPKPGLDAMLRGEGGRPFNVQILPESAVESGLGFQRRPDPDAPLGGFFRTRDNIVRLNADEMDRRTGAGAEGRRDAVGYILHESSHYLDDLGDTDQDRGYFIDHDNMRSHTRTGADGDLEPAWAHFEASRARYREISENLDDPAIRAWYTLGRRSDRTADQDRTLDRLNRHYAALSGNVSAYGAHGGDDSVTNRGVNLAEWWAETNASYLDPSRRDRLRSIDPVGYQAARHYNEMLEAGVAPNEAMPRALRFALSTEVSARQGTRILDRAGTSPMTDQNFRDIEGITEAFERHGAALDGWRPYDGNAGLKTMRRNEALAGVREGRAMIAEMDERLGTLTAGSPEHRRLTALRARLDRAVTTLETRANAL